MLVRSVAERGRQARFLPSVEAIVEHLAGECREGDVVAILSNGGFGGIHGRLLRALGAQLGTVPVPGEANDAVS